MATVCTNDDFDVNEDGQLEVAICGDDAEATLCAGGENMLHRAESDCGLFVHRTRAVEFRNQQTTTPGTVLGNPGSQMEDEVFFDVVNPSPCLPAVVTLFINHYVRFSMQPQAKVQLASVTSRNQGQQNLIGVVFENDDPAGSPNATIELKITDAVSFTATPGQTNRIYTSILARNSRGADTRVVRVLHDTFGSIVSDGR